PRPAPPPPAPGPARREAAGPPNGLRRSPCSPGYDGPCVPEKAIHGDPPHSFPLDGRYARPPGGRPGEEKRMDTGLAGRRAAVAAASQGLGFASARALVAEGARVAICGRSKE